MNVDNPETITVLSLCTGYGGLELGLALALENPLRVVAVEVEAYAMANLVAKAEEGSLAVEALWPDLRTFPAERFRGCFDFVTAGFPCQPFSVAGKRGGGTDARHLWPLICRIIEAVRPLYICLENVPGLLSGRILDNRPDLVEYLTALAQEERKADPRGRWYIGEHRRRLTARLLHEEGIQAYAGVYLDLQDLAYQVEPGLFTAEEVGAPHKRERLFILAHSESRGDNGTAGPSGEEIRRQRGALSRQSISAGQLAHAEHPRERPGIEQEASTAIGGDRFAECCWPARPGQPQYEWEEPRVVEDSGKRGRVQSPQAQGGNQDGRTGNAGEQQAESGVGRAVDGTACRVDRLRLLGNGVVPQQAAKAFRILSKQFDSTTK